MVSRIGIYSGTFDPIHQGHIAFAKATLEACELDEIIFLPERTPRSKHGATDIAHRIELIERATKNNPSFRAMSLAVEQFTVENTLPELHTLFGGARLTFLMGSDVVLTFPWPNLDTLLRDAALAIGMRASDSMDEVAGRIATLKEQYHARIECTYIQTPDAHMTSSQFRNGAADMSQLPHPSMLTYIHEYELYS